MKKILFFILLLYWYGCESPLNEIVPFSGYWNVVCFNSSGSQLPMFTILIKDDGTFSNKVKIYANVDTVFVKGAIDNNGIILAQFSDSLGNNKTGNFSGSFHEINGVKYGSGIWSDTIRGAGSIGTWTAKSN